MIDTWRSLAAAVLAGVALSGIASPVFGQAGTLPAPSRTMFNCIADRKGDVHEPALPRRAATRCRAVARIEQASHGLV
jgi:hypothetical protein